MRFKRNVTLAHGRIEAAPMIDVVFLLLIFMVLSSSFVLQPGIKVSPPPSHIREGSPYQGLVITVTRENLLFFNEQRTTMEGIRKSLQDAAKKSRAQELIIKADRFVPYGTVVEIMDAAYKAGLSAVNLATRPEPLAPETTTPSP
jgi:biopolymer transport protein ExbD